MSKYSVHQQPVETLLSWIKSGDIAIPEINALLYGKPARCAIQDNLKQNDITSLLENSEHGDLVNFMAEWRKVMAKMIKEYYESLKK